MMGREVGNDFLKEFGVSNLSVERSHLLGFSVSLSFFPFI